MVSATQQTQRRRRAKQSKNGKANKKARLKSATPKFPINPEAGAQK